MKILFVDCDGVLNCKTSNWKRKWPIDKDKADLVKKIKKETGCLVVLSSTWRNHKGGVKAVERHIGKIKGITPNLPCPAKRGTEIALWLYDYPEVTKYAILDDDTDFLAEQMDSFFQTEFDMGLTEKIAGKIINHLNS